MESLGFIFLLFVLSLALMALGIAQIYRAIRTEGARGLWHPAQMVLSIFVSAYGPDAAWLPPVVALASAALAHHIHRQDPDVPILTGLSMLGTWASCIAALLLW